jgi:hypothetical protein
MLVSVGFLLIALGTFSVALAESDTTPAPAAVSDSGKEAKPDAESEKGEPRRRVPLLGATPEERARLEEERKRLSAEAKAFATDPTAINGYYELAYGHSTFTNNLRLDTATAEVRLPITPNWFVRVTQPYVWADLNQPRGFTTNGTSDLLVRTGWRLYASPKLALLVGGDVLFPTGSNDRLSTGKYTMGPGAAAAVPLARLHSLFFLFVQNYKSVGGDPSRADINYLQVQPSFNTIWSDRWWTTASMSWVVDWNNNRKTTMNLVGEVGYRFYKSWNVFVDPGVGVVGRDTFLGLDWTVQAGIRWVFQTPLFAEKIVEVLPIQ